MAFIAWLLVFILFGSVLLSEERISFTNLGKRTDHNVSTIWRWAMRGVRGVELEWFAEGGRRFTTVEAYERFVERSTAAASGDSIPQRSNKTREAAIDRAEKECQELGI